MNPSMKDKLFRAARKKVWVNKWTRRRAEGKGEERNERNKCSSFSFCDVGIGWLL